jgi:hypothetical protein
VYASVTLRNGPAAIAEQEIAAFLTKHPQDEIARFHRGDRP